MIQSESVIETMIQYMISVLEQRHPTFGNLAICPFAHRARVQNLIQFHVDAFGLEDLHGDSALMKMIHSFKTQTQFELLFVIHPEQTAMSVEELDQFTDRLCHKIHPLNLVAYGGHPNNSFNIDGVFTRQEPFINFTVQSPGKLKSASDSLQKTLYYQSWTPENIKAVELPRQ